MSSENATRDDVANGLSIFRAVMQTFDQQISVLIEGEPTAAELASALTAIKGMVSVANDYKYPPHTSKKPPRGLGYSKDDAMVIASLPWHSNNLSAAVRAHWDLPTDDDKIRVHARRIREHRAEIEQSPGNRDVPWETSQNWLGDLIRQ